MRYYLLALMLLILSVSKIHAQQNGITMYPTSNGTSWPHKFHISDKDSNMYFSVQNNTVLHAMEIWKTDGVNNPVKVSSAPDNGVFPYHRLLGNKGDSLILLVIDMGISNHPSNFYAFDLKRDTLVSLNIDVTVEDPIKKGPHVYRTDTINNYGRRLLRMDCATLKTDTLLFVQKDTIIVNVESINNNLYVVLYDQKASGFRYRLYIADTVNRTIGKYISECGHTPIFNEGNNIYYIGYNNATGYEIFKYSTTTGSVQPVTDIYPGSVSSIDPIARNIALYNNRIYFPAFTIGDLGASLYEYNILTGTTRLVYKNQYSITKKGIDFSPEDLFVYNGRLYMTGTFSGWGRQLCVYDGADTARLVAKFQSEQLHSFGSDAKLFFEYKGDLYFAANDSTDINELYRFNDSLQRPIPPQSVVAFISPITATLYPNPTDKDAHLAITLPQAQSLQVSVTDMNGRVVYSTKQKLFSAGKHNIPLHTQQLPSGNYIYTIKNEENTLLQSGKMVKQ